MPWLDTAQQVDDLRTRVRDAKNRFRELPQTTRWGIWIGLEAALVVVFGIIDLSLGVGAAVVTTIIWLNKITDLRIRLGIEIALVVFLLIVETSAGVLIAIGLALTWVPEAWKRLAVPATALAVVIAYPYYVDHLFTIPLFGAFPSVRTGVVMLVFVIMALGLNVVVGYAGLLDLGYVAFYAMGAYMTGWFASSQFAKQKVNFGAIGVAPGTIGFHISIWLILVMAGIATAVVGVIIGLPTLRLRGDYLAIVTLGFGEILPQVARNGDSLFGTGFNLTNGPNGITPIDPPGFGNTLHNATGGILPSNYLTSVHSDRLFFWTGLVLVLITVFSSWRLRDSRLGRAWIAIREDETAAAAMGVPLMRTKTFAYAIGAFFGGVAGAYFAEFTTGANPDSFSFQFSVLVLVMVILGGIGNVWGVLVGAAFLAYLDQAGLANTGAWINQHLHVTIDVPKYEFGIYGVILLCVMLFRPHGLIPEARRKLEFEQGVADEPLYDATVS